MLFICSFVLMKNWSQRAAYGDQLISTFSPTRDQSHEHLHVQIADHYREFIQLCYCKIRVNPRLNRRCCCIILYRVYIQCRVDARLNIIHIQIESVLDKQNDVGKVDLIFNHYNEILQ